MLDATTVNRCYPVMSISYNNRTKTAVVHRMNKEERKSYLGDSGNRKAIRYLSNSSLKKLALVAMNTSSEFVSMMTLTFLSPPTPDKAKEYLKSMLQFLTRLVRRRFHYLWFMEFTKKGYIHYHLLMDIPYQKQLHHSIASYWARLIEPYNVWYSNINTRKEMKTQDSAMKVISHQKSWEPIRLKDGAKRYCLKYAMKPYQKQIPEWWKKAGRYWGADYATSQINWSEWETLPISENDLRTYLWVDDHPTKKFDVIPKYLFNFGPKTE